MPGLGAKDLRVRMYRVGFGDCFLLSLPTAAGHGHVLVDCGVHPSGNIGTLDQVLDDIESTTGKKLALVVATHEHADHISGFGGFRERFARFEIGEVWMPWAMDPEDRTATAMRLKRLALVEALTAHFAVAGGPPAAKAALANLSLSNNETAMRALRGGFTGAARAVRYFKAGDDAKSPAGLTGVSLRILGPPTDPALLKKMDPPGSQRYLHAVGGRPTPANPLHPFADKWKLAAAEGRHRLGFPAAEERDLKDQLEDSAARLAFALDSAVNNTSLVVLITCKGRSLLFPGDAQWGNWKAWLDKADSGNLLEQISFLKVSHHGSFNATPKSALEGMTTGAFAAMASTQSQPWKTIPQAQLMRRLGEKTRRKALRSDSLRRAGTPEGPRLPAKLPAGFSRGDSLWLDYTMRV